MALRPYQSVDQLSKIWGVDPAVLQRIVPLVSVDQPAVGFDLQSEARLVPPHSPSQPNEAASSPQVSAPSIARAQVKNFLENNLGAGVDPFAGGLLSAHRP